MEANRVIHSSIHTRIAIVVEDLSDDDSHFTERVSFPVREESSVLAAMQSRVFAHHVSQTNDSLSVEIYNADTGERIRSLGPFFNRVEVAISTSRQDQPFNHSHN